jgi:putative intracellular protease/amidase
MSKGKVAIPVENDDQDQEFAQEVARDGNLITSRNPDDLPAFRREIIRALREV